MREEIKAIIAIGIMLIVVIAIEWVLIKDKGKKK